MKNVRKITSPAIVAALYATLTIVLAPISYGVFQFRISEALCVLPFLFPGTAVGLFIGCAVANLISAAGVLDVIFGSLATLLAALCSAHIGKRCRNSLNPDSIRYPIFACAMPVLFNGPIIGAVLAYTYTPEAFWMSTMIFGLQVAFGELVVLYVIGLPLIKVLQKTDLRTHLNGAR